jgi:hypothetical protein
MERFDSSEWKKQSRRRISEVEKRDERIRIHLFAPYTINLVFIA